jgi:adenylate cyclase
VIGPPTGRCATCGNPLGGKGAPRLILRGAMGDVAEYPVGAKAVIGRSTGAEVQLADREVSRRHSIIEFEQGEYVLKDLGSSNGTFINGRRMYAPHKLRDGDEVLIGTTRLVFRMGDATEKEGAKVVTGTEEEFKPEAVVARVAATKPFPSVDQITDVTQLKRDYERLRIGHEFSRTVRLERDMHQLLAKILEVAFELIPADNGVILLRDTTTNQLVVEAVRQRKPDAGKVLVSDTLLAQVMATREGVLTSDALADARFQSSQSIIGLSVRSAMAVPLIVKGEVRGVMFLDSRERIAAFTTKDLEVLSAIASQASVAIENSEMARDIEQKGRERAHLERFLPPALVEQVARGAIDLTKGGALSELTVLFSDIRGFTSMSEKQPPQDVVRMLNDYFEVMVDVVFAQGGMLDKFIGDAIMALWGAPVKRADDAMRAVKAALQMQEKLKEFNLGRAEQGKPPVNIGIGVNTAEVVVGNLGSTKTMQYTAIGDGVNLASRLCSVSPAGQITVSEETMRKAGDGFQFEALPPVKVKGKEQPITVYRVLS